MLCFSPRDALCVQILYPSMSLDFFFFSFSAPAVSASRGCDLLRRALLCVAIVGDARNTLVDIYIYTYIGDLLCNAVLVSTPMFNILLIR